MSKKVKIVLGVSLIVLAIVAIIISTVFIGDTSWQPTFEEAFADRKQASDKDWSDSQYQVKSSVGKIYYDNCAYWIYESESEELAMVGFKYDGKKNKYKYDLSGSFGQIDNLFDYQSNPSEGAYSITLDNENLWGCRVHDGLTPYVNGEKARIYATYSIEYNGTTYSVDWWDIVGFDHNLYDTMTLEFLAE